MLSAKPVARNTVTALKPKQALPGCWLWGPGAVCAALVIPCVCLVPQSNVKLLGWLLFPPPKMQNRVFPSEI